jgi:hypothetical protein
LKWGEPFLSRPWKVDEPTGYATLPEGPGLGVRVNPERMAKLASDPKYQWRWPGATLPDGSVADY